MSGDHRKRYLGDNAVNPSTTTRAHSDVKESSAREDEEKSAQPHNVSRPDRTLANVQEGTRVAKQESATREALPGSTSEHGRGLGRKYSSERVVPSTPTRSALQRASGGLSLTPPMKSPQSRRSFQPTSQPRVEDSTPEVSSEPPRRQSENNMAHTEEMKEKEDLDVLPPPSGVLLAESKETDRGGGLSAAYPALDATASAKTQVSGERQDIEPASTSFNIAGKNVAAGEEKAAGKGMTRLSSNHTDPTCPPPALVALDSTDIGSVPEAPEGKSQIETPAAALDAKPTGENATVGDEAGTPPRPSGGRSSGGASVADDPRAGAGLNVPARAGSHPFVSTAAAVRVSSDNKDAGVPRKRHFWGRVPFLGRGGGGGSRDEGRGVWSRAPSVTQMKEPNNSEHPAEAPFPSRSSRFLLVRVSAQR